ncbi:MAG: hypothetical protein COA81_07770 [Alphaproteobacteria bacterium]|nr:MAG: hypothetical protein COA81_07770 [Alphaproteobacteria bacterium]
MTEKFSQLWLNSTSANNGYLRTTEFNDVLYSLQHCKKCLEGTSENVQNWKWVIISTQAALQGAYVCHLNDTAQLNVLSTKSAEKWLTWYNDPKNNKSNPPNCYIDYFKELHEKIRMGFPNAGQAITYSNIQNDAVNLLIDLRNQFTHFSPCGWSIELLGLPNMTLRCMEIIELIEKDDWPFRHMSQNNKAELKDTVQNIKNECSQLHKEYYNKWNS